MKRFLLAVAVAGLLTGCATGRHDAAPINPSVPYPENRGPGSIGSPPFQQGSVPTTR